MSDSGFTASQLEQFEQDGFLIVRNLAAESLRVRIMRLIDSSLNPPLGPLEYETDVNYPGSPSSQSSPGGLTPRRLLNAYSRDAVLREWAGSSEILSVLKALMGTQQVKLTQNHHNCIMTKMPEYSSKTGWHQDIRYWCYDRPELINVWLALGEESIEKGGMKLIPGSHKLDLDRGRFDAELFLRADLPENQQLIASAVDAELQAGDVLFFHCKTFHVAGKNLTNQAKYSLVYSYHAADNLPIPGTRSSRLESVLMA